MPPVVDTSQPQPLAPPGRYPAGTGKRYWGEFPGYTYDPYSDAYYPDRSTYEHYQESSGLAPPKPRTPSPWEAVVPLAALAGTTWALSDSGRSAISSALGASQPPVAGAPEGLSATGGWATGGAAGGGDLLAASAAPEAPTLLSASRVPAQGVGFAPYLGLAGAGLGAYGLYQGIKEGSPKQGALGGAALGGGLAAAAPLLGFGPLGWAGIGIGALGGGLLGGGLASVFGDKDLWKTEGNRLRELQEQGINVPQPLIDAMPTKGRSKQELIEIERARGDAGNVKFAQSRNESDLRPVDIVNYATFAENDSNWFNRPMEERLALAQRALEAGAVREHHGTVDVDWKKVPTTPVAQAGMIPVAPAIPPAPQNTVAFGQVPVAAPPIPFNNITPPNAMVPVAPAPQKPKKEQWKDTK